MLISPPTVMGLEEKKLEREIEKLDLDIESLQFQIRHRWRALTLTWPIISGATTLLLAIVLGFVNISLQNKLTSIQREQSDREHYRLLVSSLENATDITRGPDRRIAGIWTLVSYWRDPRWPQYESDLQNTLSVLLITDRSKDSTYDDSYSVREAAALAIGDAIKPEDSDLSRVRRLSKLLYGSAETWETGSVVRQNWFLKNHKEIPDYENKLWATKEAIRWNWEYLEKAHLAGAELARISLYKANLKNAYMAEANLEEADLRGADLEGATLDGANLNNANLEYANLYKASLMHVANWTTINFTGANIKSIRAPNDLISWAKSNGAVELDSQDWRNMHRQ